MATFDFGPISTTFTAGSGSQAELELLRKELASAKAALALSERRSEILWGAFHWTRTRLVHAPHTMSERDDYYEDELARLHERLAEKQLELDSKQKELDSLRAHKRDTARELDATNKEARLTDQRLVKEQEAHDATRRRLEKAEALKQEAEKVRKHSDDLLAKLYADNAHIAAERDGYRESSDQWQLRYHDVELQLASLHREWEEDQKKFHDKEQEIEDIKAAEEIMIHHLDALQAQFAVIQDSIAPKDHLIEVKDRRIEQLEKELQKALTDDRRTRAALAAAEAARSPLSSPLIPPADSLAAELEDLESVTVFDEQEEDEEGEPEHNFDLVSQVPSSIVAISPLEARRPELTVSAISTAIDRAPISPEIPRLAVSNVVTSFETRPVPANSASLSLSGITASVHTEPFTAKAARLPPVPKESHTPNLSSSSIKHLSTAPAPAVQASISCKHTETDAQPTTKVVHIVPERARLAADKSNLMLYFFIVLAAISSFLCIRYKRLLHEWEFANTSHYASCRGPYGSSAYLFGWIPIGFGFGNGFLSDKIERHMAIMLQSFEDWVGNDGRFLH